MSERESRALSRTRNGNAKSRSRSTKNKKKVPNPIQTQQKPRPSLNSNVETPALQNDTIVFDFKPGTSGHENSNEEKKRGRHKVSPPNTEPMKRLKMDSSSSPSTPPKNLTPISQFNAPNCAFQRTNHYAERNIPKLQSVTKNGKTITPKAKSSFYFDNEGVKQRYKVEKPYIKSNENRRNLTNAMKALADSPSIEVVKGFRIVTGSYSYDPTIDGEVPDELSVYLRNLITRTGVTKQDVIDQLFKFGYEHCKCSNIDDDLHFVNCECGAIYKIQMRPTHQARCLESGKYKVAPRWTEFGPIGTMWNF